VAFVEWEAMVVVYAQTLHGTRGPQRTHVGVSGDMHLVYNKIARARCMRGCADDGGSRTRRCGALAPAVLFVILRHGGRDLFISPTTSRPSSPPPMSTLSTLPPELLERIALFAAAPPGDPRAP
jgi:hypothetical protein